MKKCILMFIVALVSTMNLIADPTSPICEPPNDKSMVADHMVRAVMGRHEGTTIDTNTGFIKMDCWNFVQIICFTITKANLTDVHSKINDGSGSLIAIGVIVGEHSEYDPLTGIESHFIQLQ
jgi:hypothetical protein